MTGAHLRHAGCRLAVFRDDVGSMGADREIRRGWKSGTHWYLHVRCRYGDIAVPDICPDGGAGASANPTLSVKPRLTILFPSDAPGHFIRAGRSGTDALVTPLRQPLTCIPGPKSYQSDKASQ